MTNDAVRLVPVAQENGAGGVAEVLGRLQEHTLGLLAGLAAAPRSLEWPDPAAAPVPGAAVAAAPAGPPPAAPTGTAQPAGTLQPAGSAQAGHHITAHTVGVFHHAPSPGAEPFVRVGDTVTPGQQVGIIEAMKLMIAVEADAAGRITEVLVPNASPVEFGEKLFAYEPA
jgi:acetyl-CoA carboxylase biotin carboxyl carrier protein